MTPGIRKDTLGHRGYFFDMQKTIKETEMKQILELMNQRAMLLRKAIRRAGYILERI